MDPIGDFEKKVNNLYSNKIFIRIFYIIILCAVVYRYGDLKNKNITTKPLKNAIKNAITYKQQSEQAVQKQNNERNNIQIKYVDSNNANNNTNIQNTNDNITTNSNKDVNEFQDEEVKDKDKLVYGKLLTEEQLSEIKKEFSKPSTQSLKKYPIVKKGNTIQIKFVTLVKSQFNNYSVPTTLTLILTQNDIFGKYLINKHVNDVINIKIKDIISSDKDLKNIDMGKDNNMSMLIKIVKIVK